MVAEALAEVLGVEQGFFYTELPTELYEEDVHFRHRNRMLVADKNRALAHGSLFSEFVTYLEHFVDLPVDAVPPITGRPKNMAEIELAAEECRLRWEVGLARPLDNIVRTLENAGVVVMLADGYVEKVDAFSARCPSGRRIIVLNRKDSASRSVFNVAHELGHLMMHEGVVTGDAESEREADSFASAFLLPRTGFAREFPRGNDMDWTALIRLKARWKVSLQAMVRRAYDLGLIGAAQYQRAYKYISARRWRLQEPGEFAFPSPELVPAAVQALRVHFDLTPLHIARALALKPSTLRDIAGVYDAPDAPLDPNKVIPLSYARNASKRRQS